MQINCFYHDLGLQDGKYCSFQKDLSFQGCKYLSFYNDLSFQGCNIVGFLRKAIAFLKTSCDQHTDHDGHAQTQARLWPIC
jgi:hypothetical protein